MNYLCEKADFKDKKNRIKEKLALAVRNNKELLKELYKVDFVQKSPDEIFNLLNIFLETDIEKKPASSVNKIKTNEVYTKIKCKVCGKSIHTKDKCRFKDSECYVCHRKGRISSVC